MEANHNPTCPIAGEPAPANKPLEIVPLVLDITVWQLRRIENIATCLLRVMSGIDLHANEAATAFMELKALEDHIKSNAESEQADLKDIRAMLNLAQNEYARGMMGKAQYGPSLDLAATVDTAVQWLDELLGITEPADEDPYSGDAEGEMRAEADAERRADAAAELAAELASCDWEGWD